MPERLAAAAVIFTVVPFAFFGESWGSYWYAMNLPSSEVFKDLWEWAGTIPYIVTATFANWYIVTGAFIGIAMALNSILEELFRGPNPDGGTTPPARTGA